MTSSGLDLLVAELRQAFQQAPGPERAARVSELLRAYAASDEDWRELLFFDPACYTRNLVVRTEAFELLVLGWSAGQASPIHNHEGQDCWMAVLEGEIEEVRFDMPAPPAGDPRPLRELGSKVCRAGDVAFIRDEIGLHLVRTATPDRAGVSLHLYAAPYDACNVYCPDTGRITRKPLSNYSERGRLLV